MYRARLQQRLNVGRLTSPVIITKTLRQDLFFRRKPLFCAIQSFRHPLMLGIERLKLFVDASKLQARLFDSVFDHADCFGDVELLNLLLVNAAPNAMNTTVKAAQLLSELVPAASPGVMIGGRPWMAFRFRTRLRRGEVARSREDDRGPHK